MNQLRIHIIRNFIPALRSQLPFKRLIKNILNGKVLGLFHPRSHYRSTEDGTLKEKMGYPTLESALKAANTMEKKKGYRFSAYGCLYCGNFHVGANRYSMNKETEQEKQ